MFFRIKSNILFCTLLTIISCGPTSDDSYIKKPIENNCFIQTNIGNGKLYRKLLLPDTISSFHNYLKWYYTNKIDSIDIGPIILVNNCSGKKIPYSISAPKSIGEVGHSDKKSIIFPISVLTSKKNIEQEFNKYVKISPARDLNVYIIILPNRV